MCVCRKFERTDIDPIETFESYLEVYLLSQNFDLVFERVFFAFERLFINTFDCYNIAFVNPSLSHVNLRKGATIGFCA